MRSAMLAFGVLVLSPLVGCSGDAPPVTASTATADARDAQARVGDVSVQASVVQTSMLDEAVARQYGLQRSDRVAMLLVSPRRDGDSAMPASLAMEARVVPGNGSGMPVALHPVTVDGLVDYVGTVDVAPPETLRFDVVVTYGTATSTLQFTRDFFPR